MAQYSYLFDAKNEAEGSSRTSLIRIRSPQDEAAALVLESPELAALLAVTRARDAAELERQAARLRALLGPAASALEPHVAALRAQHEQLAQAKQLAATDALTGAANRRGFNQALRRELGRSARRGAPIAVAMFDLDDFKSINDRFGHKAGDDALRLVASCAQRVSRQGDLVARLGGDELVLLLPETDAASAGVIGERVRADVAAESLRRGPCAIGLSLGVASVRGTHASVQQLLAEADRALYRDKQARRARASGSA